jgi:general L-amino acid transport system permease protein
MAIYEEKQSRSAPSNLKGPLRWVLHNLLATPLDVAMTFLVIAFLFWAIPPFIHWAVLDANFIGTTRADCTGTGACWVFISQKLSMFMYGFYPSEEVYRVNTVYALFFVFIFMFKYLNISSSKKLGIFLIYPIISFFIISGGYFGLPVIDTSDWGGLMLTLVVASTGIVISLPLGIVIAFGRRSKLPIINKLSVLYVEFIRGVPLITLLFMGSVILPLFFDEGIDFDKLLRALIVITLFQAAYVAEVIRGGLQAVPKGQYEAADSLGLTYWQKMLMVILPQALKVSIPNLVGVSIALFKDTTLLLIIGLFDLLAMVHLTTDDSHWLGFDVEGYVFITFIYWFFCFAMSKYSKVLEKRFNTENK